MGDVLRVLIGESNILESQVAAENLSLAFPNIETTTVDSHDDFLSALEYNSYDVVVAYNRLPGFQGVEIIDAIHQRNLKSQIVFMAQPGDEKLCAEAIRRGVSELVVKTPNYPELIPSLVGKAVQKKGDSEVAQLLQGELRKSEDRYQKLLEETKEPIAIIQHGKFRFANQIFARFVKAQTKDSLFGLSVEDFVDEDSLEKLTSILQQLETGNTGSKSAKVLMKLCDSNKVWVTFHASCVAYKGQPCIKVAWRPVDEASLDISNNSTLKRLQRVFSDTQKLTNFTKMSEIAPKLLESFSKNLSVNGGSLYLKENKRLRLLKSLDNEKHQPQYIEFPLVEDSVLDRVFKENKPVFIHQIKDNEKKPSSGWDGYKDDSAMVVTLRDDTGEIKGLVSLHNKIDPPFTPTDLHLSKILASYGQLAMKNAELNIQLQEMEKKFHIQNNDSLTGVAIIQNGKIAYANSNFANILHYGKDEASKLIDQPYRIFIPPEDRESMATNLKLIFEYEDTTARSKIKLLTNSGEIIYAEIMANLISHNGKPAVACNFVDVTDYKKTVTVENNDHQFVNQILENISDMVTVTDKDGLITYTNAPTANAIQTDRNTLIGKHISDVYGNCSAFDNADKDFCSAVMEGRFDGKVSSTDSESHKLLFRIKSEPLLSANGQKTGLIITTKNITKEEQLEQQVMETQKTEVTSSLMAGLAHDFNNLLTGITGYVQIAMMKLDPKNKLYTNLEQINQATKQTNILTKRLLSFSKKQNIDPKVINLNESVNNLYKMLDHLLDNNIEMQLRTREINSIKANPIQVDQIIMNFVVNAQDAMPKGGILTIETQNVNLDDTYCKTHPYVTPGSYVMLAVHDSGIGMDEKTRKNVFEPFFTTKKENGTGLGLSTVYSIVKQHRGFVEVESTPGEGSTFRVYFPCTKDKADNSLSYNHSKVPGGNETILLLEDEPIVAEMNYDFLTHLGYKVIRANSSEEAIDLAKQHNIQMLITAVSLPRISGSELTKIITPDCDGLRVLYTSGYTRSTVIRHGLMEQGDNFISKPYEPLDLAVQIREVLDN